MPLIMSGKLHAVRKGTFDGKDFASLQFVETDRYGGVVVQSVYLPDGHDASRYTVGSDIDLPVTVSINKKGGLSFRLVEDAGAQSAPRPGPRRVI
jgi:hypothetical protein